MNQRDLELLSAYLDGELKPSESARLETRLKNDLELASVLNDLRATRTLLRKLPQRRAPRNFTLTRRMVGQNPPLPRAYPALRFATSLATLLLFATLAVNFFTPQVRQQANFGRGGGADVEMYAAEAPATEAPMLAEPAAPAPAPAEPMAPAPTAAAAVEEPSIASTPQETAESPTEQALRLMETPAQKNGGEENLAGQSQPTVQEDAVPASEEQAPSKLISSVWQVGLAVVAVMGALFMILMRRFSARRWK